MVRAGDIVVIRDGRWRVLTVRPHGAATVIETRGCDATNRAARATFLLPFEPVTVARTPHPAVVSRGRWRRAARQILSDVTPAWWSLKRGVDATFDVLPYQLAPALALTRGDACRFLLADAVGLGKTVQAALMVAETFTRWPDARAIVICPAGLREQWREELARRFRIDARIVDAAAQARLANELPPAVNPWTIHGVVITSIDYVKRPEVARALEALVWDVAVFDEAHNLAGHSDRATTAHLIAGRARHVVLVTATPHSGDADDFERLCGIGALNDEPLLVFRRTRATLGLPTRARMRFLHVRPTPEERHLQDTLSVYVRQVWNRRGAPDGARLAMMILMRRACSSPAALARSVERRLAYLDADVPAPAPQPGLPFGPADAEPDAILGVPGLPDAHSELDTLRLILEQARRASAAESKVRALRKLLRRLREPAIVFTEYRDTLEDLARVVGGPRTLVLHGGLTPRERQDVITEFANGAGRLLLSTDAGSEGVNLHHRCRTVVNIELPWMPRRLEQRAGRVDRIGQKHQVHVINLVAKGTSEESVLTRLAVRHLHAEGALQQLSTPSEADIASAVMSGATLPAETPVRVPAGVVAATSLHDSLNEAARIVTGRRMRSRGADVPEATVLARARWSRRGQTARQCIWVMTSACATTFAINLWDAPLPFRGVPSSGIHRSRSQIRRVLDPRRVIASAPVVRRVAELESEMRESLAAACRRWRAREEALLRHLMEHDARLSLALVQPGLFDRRVARLAEAQAEAMTTASGRCHDRIAILEQLPQVRLDEPTCLFGLLLE